MRVWSPIKQFLVERKNKLNNFSISNFKKYKNDKNNSFRIIFVNCHDKVFMSNVYKN